MTGLFIYDVEGKSCPARLVDGIPELQVNDFDHQTFPFQIAIKSANGNKTWYMNGKRHRLDGPAIEYANGDKSWYMNGERHRLDGPAREYANGDKIWYMNGKRHRLDGPAIEYADGDKFWYVNGKFHRLDGPAIERSNGDKEWWVDHVQYDEADFPAAVQRYLVNEV